MPWGLGVVRTTPPPPEKKKSHTRKHGNMNVYEMHIKMCTHQKKKKKKLRTTDPDTHVWHDTPTKTKFIKVYTKNNDTVMSSTWVHNRSISCCIAKWDTVDSQQDIVEPFCSYLMKSVSGRRIINRQFYV